MDSILIGRLREHDSAAAHIQHEILTLVFGDQGNRYFVTRLREGPCCVVDLVLVHGNECIGLGLRHVNVGYQRSASSER